MALELKNPFTDRTKSTVIVTDVPAAQLPPPRLIVREITYKIALVGDKAVGKSSLLHRLCANSFDTAYKPTQAIDLYRKSVTLPGGISAILEFTDLSGSACGSFLFENSVFGVDAVVFVYDITNLQSFKHLNEWLAGVKKVCVEHKCNPLLALIGNKMDLTHQRCVSPLDHIQLAEKHRLLPFLISTRLGDLVTVVFRRIAAELAGVKLDKSDTESASEVIPALIVDHLQNDPAQAPLVLPSKSSVCVIQ